MKKILALILMMMSQISFALTCDMLAFNMDDIRTQLRRAASESDFEYAKDYSRKARSAFFDASMGAMDCECS